MLRYFFETIMYPAYSTEPIYSIIVMALFGHCVSQALQTRHSSTLTGTAFPSFSSYTPTGQTSTQVPHPVHFSGSTFIFTMPRHLEPDFSEKDLTKIKAFGIFMEHSFRDCLL